MVRTDPYSSERDYFECRGCQNRVASEERPEECPECGSPVKNLAVPRE